MKKFLFTLIISILTSVSFAQDIIKKLDGGTILVKVLEITQDEIKYKNYDNLEGPSYTLNKTLINTITYENGTVEEIAQVLNFDADIKKAKRLKITGAILGGSITLGGLILRLYANSEYGDNSTVEDADYYYNNLTSWGTVLAGAGVVTFGVLYLRGRSIEKKANRYQVSALNIKEIQLNNGNSLMADFDVFNDSQSGNRSIGLGIRFNF